MFYFIKEKENGILYPESDSSVKILLYEPRLTPLKPGELFLADYCSDNRAGNTRSDRSYIFNEVWMTLVVTADSRHLLNAEHCCQLFVKSSVTLISFVS